MPGAISSLKNYFYFESPFKSRRLKKTNFFFKKNTYIKNYYWVINPYALIVLTSISVAS